MKALVVVGAGYIGSVVTRLLVSQGHDVLVLDDCSTGHADAVPPGVELVESDITASTDLLAGGDFDAVLHFAAKSLVGESVQQPSLYWRTNVYGTRVLLDAITAEGVPRLVFSSTAATYGEPSDIPITEDSPTRPTNTYGSTKLAVDMMIGTSARPVRWPPCRCATSMSRALPSAPANGIEWKRTSSRSRCRPSPDDGTR